MKTGIIDIGSNSVRMAWLDDKPLAGTLPEERLRYSRLAENATASGHLSGEATKRTIEAVSELLEEAAENDVNIKRISSTSVLREADNRQEVKAQMEAALGRKITVLHGYEEAQYSYQGAVYGLGQTAATAAVLDVGGGSTELCWGTDSAQNVSVPVGAVRLKEAADYIGPLQKALAPVTEYAPKGQQICLVGVGGTLTTMAAIFEGMKVYHAAEIHQKCYAFDAIKMLNQKLKAMSLEERLCIPGLLKGRADIITQGLDIVLTVMRAVEAQRITISTTDLLFGQLLALTNG